MLEEAAIHLPEVAVIVTGVGVGGARRQLWLAWVAFVLAAAVAFRMLPCFFLQPSFLAPLWSRCEAWKWFTAAFPVSSSP